MQRKLKFVFNRPSASSNLGHARVGEAEKFLRAVFKSAAAQESIIFIDEIETLFKNRSKGAPQTAHLITLQAELFILLNGIEGKNTNTMFLAATNNIDMMDPALLRRLEIQIFMGLPDYKERFELFNYYLNSPQTHQIVLSRDFDTETLLKKTDFCSNGNIEAICQKIADGLESHMRNATYFYVKLKNKWINNYFCTVDGDSKYI